MWLRSGLKGSMAASGVFAQQAAPVASRGPAAVAAHDMSPIANPVIGFVKAGVARYEKNMVAAAEAMPAEKYAFKPSPEMNSFGHLIMHIAQSNNTFCSMCMIKCPNELISGDGLNAYFSAIKIGKAHS